MNLRVFYLYKTVGFGWLQKMLWVKKNAVGRKSDFLQPRFWLPHRAVM